MNTFHSHYEFPGNYNVGWTIKYRIQIQASDSHESTADILYNDRLKSIVCQPFHERHKTASTSVTLSLITGVYYNICTAINVALTASRFQDSHYFPLSILCLLSNTVSWAWSLCSHVSLITVEDGVEEFRIIGSELAAGGTNCFFPHTTTRYDLLQTLTAPR